MRGDVRVTDLGGAVKWERCEDGDVRGRDVRGEMEAGEM